MNHLSLWAACHFIRCSLATGIKLGDPSMCITWVKVVDIYTWISGIYLGQKGITQISTSSPDLHKIYTGRSTSINLAMNDMSTMPHFSAQPSLWSTFIYMYNSGGIDLFSSWYTHLFVFSLQYNRTLSSFIQRFQSILLKKIMNCNQTAQNGILLLLQIFLS